MIFDLFKESFAGYKHAFVIKMWNRGPFDSGRNVFPDEIFNGDFLIVEMAEHMFEDCVIFVGQWGPKLQNDKLSIGGPIRPL